MRALSLLGVVVLSLLCGRAWAVDESVVEDREPSESQRNPSTPGVVPGQVTPPKLLSPEPIVVCEALPEGAGGTVQLSVVIGTEGRALEVSVIQGKDKTCDEAVVATVMGLEFESARLEGAPVAVRIQWTVGVQAPPIPKPPPVPTATIDGVLVEKGSRAVLVGLTVELQPYGAQVISDQNGRFSFDAVPHGEVTLLVPSFDHEALEITLNVPLKEPVRLRLRPRPRSQYRTRIMGPVPDTSRVVVSAAEAAEIPGGAGDPVRVIEVMPGVAHVSGAGPTAGQIVVRGSAPEDTKYFVDGLPSPQLYHFGNLYSIFQEPYIQDIDFRAGGFSAEYGDATGGILNLTLAPVPTDGPHFRGDVNVYHTSVTASTPVSDKWAVSAGVRRSYFDAFLGSILESSGAGASLVAAPVYYDYQARADYNPSADSRLRLFVYGSDDTLAVDFAEPAASDPQTTGFGVGRKVHQIQATWKHVLTPNLVVGAGLVSGYQALNFNIGPERNFNLRVCPLVAQGDAEYRLNKKLKLRGGVLSSTQSYGVSLDLSRQVKEGQVNLPTASQEQFSIDVDGFQFRTDAWTEARYEPTETIGMILGARAATWFGGFNDVAVEPRMNLYWKANESTRLTLGAGMNYQAPFPDETAEEIGNPDLEAERALYGVIGIKQSVADVLTLDLQLFAKGLSNLVSPTTFDPENLDQVPYNNAGEGRVLGAELLARLTLDRMTAWLTYTLSRSVRTDRPGEPERLFSYDQTHVVSLVSSVVLGAGWKTGLRMRYSTGNPYTPLTVGYYDSNADVFVPRPVGPPLSDRIDDFFSLDLRVSKEFRYDNWILDVYLELNNATNRLNVENVGYNYDYSERNDINGLPIYPAFGVKGMY